MTFVARHALWSDEQKDAATRMRRIVEEKNLEVIRLAFPDQHGILRGKTIIAAEAIASLESGCSITTTMLAKDTSHRTVFPVFTSGGGFGMKEMEGAADVLMVADPTTFRVLPWAPATGWVHISPSSLRAQRSNPDCLRGKILDCFAALAMTENVAGILHPSSIVTEEQPK